MSWGGDQMPWTASSGNTYNLCLLDTNALSEIVKHPTCEGRGFIECFPPSCWVPCWTIYNLIELRRAEGVYEDWLSFFSTYPCFLLKPFEQLLSDEVAAHPCGPTICPLAHAFAPLGVNTSYDLRAFVDRLFSDPLVASLEQTWTEDQQRTLDIWSAGKTTFEHTNEDANARDADTYVLHAGVEAVARSHPEWVEPFHKSGSVPDLRMLPSLQVMLYSQYYRLHGPQWSQRPGEVTDVQIMAVVPYMDAVVTERFQAEVLRKIRHSVRGLDRVRVATLRDLRRESKLG
jgi:hypothetical protein